MSAAKVADTRTGTEWLDGLTQSDTPPSPLTARVDRSCWSQYTNQWVRNLWYEWSDLQHKDIMANYKLDHLHKGTQRYADAVERILRRRQRMWELVEEAVRVPASGRLTRMELQRFADRIEIAGSVHNGTDLLLIEARIEATAPKPPPPPPKPSAPPPARKPRKRKDKAAPPGGAA